MTDKRCGPRAEREVLRAAVADWRKHYAGCRGANDPALIPAQAAKSLGAWRTAGPGQPGWWVSSTTTVNSKRDFLAKWLDRTYPREELARVVDCCCAGDAVLPPDETCEAILTLLAEHAPEPVYRRLPGLEAVLTGD